ncbi:DUF2794 domain-containing protein [Pelagibacteraceae bacterium]|nr:DUF2794 domain-containing protein [Pelagibacteraceae bacterium]
MRSVSSTSLTNNHKLYFSKVELSKILTCYSIGVSNGNWKDYALNFSKNEAIFSFYKHTLASPECILKKFEEKKKKRTFYQLCINNNKNSKYEDIDQIIASIKRSQLSIVEI